jgi:hypothetical protein
MGELQSTGEFYTWRKIWLSTTQGWACINVRASTTPIWASMTSVWVDLNLQRVYTTADGTFFAILRVYDSMMKSPPSHMVPGLVIVIQDSLASQSEPLWHQASGWAFMTPASSTLSSVTQDEPQYTVDPMRLNGLFLIRARICTPFKEPRNRFPARHQGSLNVCKFGLWSIKWVLTVNGDSPPSAVWF